MIIKMFIIIIYIYYQASQPHKLCWEKEVDGAVFS